MESGNIGAMCGSHVLWMMAMVLSMVLDYVDVDGGANDCDYGVVDQDDVVDVVEVDVDGDVVDNDVIWKSSCSALSVRAVRGTCDGQLTVKLCAELSLSAVCQNL